MSEIHISSSPNQILILSCVVFFMTPVSQVMQIYQIPAVRKITVKICGKNEGDANKSVATQLTQLKKKETFVQMAKETSSTIVDLLKSETEENSMKQQNSFVQKIISTHDAVGYLGKLYDLL